MLIGQKKLLKTFGDLIEKNTIPKFIVLVGPKGSGKKHFVKYLLSLFQWGAYNPTDLKVDSVRSMIEDSLTLSKERAYLLLDADEMTIQAQNALLKFAEEPSKYSFIFMTVENTNNILDTIRSRASVYTMDPYSIDELKEVTEDEKLIEICDNPGQIIRVSEGDYLPLLQTAFKVVDNIGKINAANAFSILKHIDQEALDIFLLFLGYALEEKMIKGTLEENKKTLGMLRVLYYTKLQLSNKSINKVNALEMMFIRLREAAI